MAIQPIVEGEFIEGGNSGDFDADLNAAWNSFRDQIDAEANSVGSIAVFKIPAELGVARPKTLQKVRLFSCAVGTMTLDDICDRVLRDYMLPGEQMMIQLYGSMSGRKGIILNRIIPLQKAHVSADKKPASDIEIVLKTIAERDVAMRQEMREMLQAIVSSRAPASITPAVDPMQFGMQLAEKLTSMAANLAGARGGAGAAPDWQQSMIQTMQTMTLMREFFDRDNGSKPKPENSGDFLAIIREVASVARPMLESHAAREKQAAAMASRGLPAPAPVSAPTTTEPKAEESTAPAPQAETKPSEDEMRLLEQLKTALPTIIEIAARNGDPVETAKLAMDTMPEYDAALNDALFSLVSDEKCITRLALLDPRVNEHAAWFEKFRAAILAEFEPDAPAS